MVFMTIIVVCHDCTSVVIGHLFRLESSTEMHVTMCAMIIIVIQT